MNKLLTRPIKRYTDGGELDWGRIGRKLSNAYDSIQPIAGGPEDAGFTQTFQPLSGGIKTGTPLGSTVNLGSTFSSLKSGVGAMAPFASNIINSLRTPPRPALPTMDNMVSLKAPSYENEKNDISRQINADSELAGRAVDGQTAARIRLFNTGQKLDRLSAVNEREANAKVGVGNEQARINASIMSGNNRKMDQYNESLTERDIANQREKSANLANLSDKIVGIQNENEKRRVDLEKTRTMAHMFDNSGVLQRLRKQKMDAGEDDPLGIEYSDIKKKALGGVMSNVPRRSFYRGIQGRAQTLKSLYRAPN